MNDYFSLKEQYLEIIRKAKAADPALGLYLEQHMEFNDEKEEMAFTGDMQMPEDILARIIISS